MTLIGSGVFDDCVEATQKPSIAAMDSVGCDCGGGNLANGYSACGTGRLWKGTVGADVVCNGNTEFSTRQDEMEVKWSIEATILTVGTGRKPLVPLGRLWFPEDRSPCTYSPAPILPRPCT